VSDGFEVLSDESGFLMLGEHGGIKGVKDEVKHPEHGLQQIWAKLLELEHKIDMLNGKVSEPRTS